MHYQLSPQSEQYLNKVVSGGLFSSKAAALDAAVEALREKTEPIPAVPDDHLERVEQAITSADAGQAAPMTADDWAALRQRAVDAAARPR